MGEDFLQRLRPAVCSNVVGKWLLVLMCLGGWGIQDQCFTRELWPRWAGRVLLTGQTPDPCHL